MINMGLLDISTHKHGCCAIQKILESDSENTESIINNIINNALTLITHQYGNYTIQYILQMKNSKLDKIDYEQGRYNSDGSRRIT